MPTRAVFFDFYNTLAHYQPRAEQIQIDALAALGIDVPLPRMQRAIAMGDHYFYEENRRFSVARLTQSEQSRIYFKYEETVLREAGVNPDPALLKQVWDKVEAAARGMGYGLFEDALPALRAAKAEGLLTGVISNIPPEKLSVLKTLGISDLTDVTVIPRDAGADKPDPAIFRVAVEKAGVAAAEAVHVGDQYYIDVVGALGAGLKAILLDRLGLFPQYTDCPRVTSLDQVAGLL